MNDYKSQVQGALRAKSLWTPGKTEAKSPNKPLTREEKEQEVIKTLLSSIKISIPKILIDNEVDSRLAKFLQRLERLGLSLESYLSSVGKTAKTIREEYERQAREAISLDLILTKISKIEKIEVKKEKIDEAIKAANADRKLAEKLDTPEQRRLIELVLKKRSALESLVEAI